MWKFKQPKYIPVTILKVKPDGKIETLLPKFPVKVEYVRDKLNPGDPFNWTTGTLIGKREHFGTVLKRTYYAATHSYVIEIEEVV